MIDNVTIKFYRDVEHTERILRATVEVADGVAVLDRPAPSKYWSMNGTIHTADTWQLQDSTGRVLADYPSV